MVPLVGAALLACLAALAAAVPQHLGGSVVLEAEPFGLSEVTLAVGSRLREQRDANIDWLMHLEPASLTCLYTSAANLTCSSTGVPYRCIVRPTLPTVPAPLPLTD